MRRINMKAKRRKVDPLHREATKLAAESDCLLCGAHGCEPAHWPRHRGSGGRFEHPWAREHWIPLCPICHNLVDRRLGVSAAIEERYLIALLLLGRRAAEWWTVD